MSLGSGGRPSPVIQRHHGSFVCRLPGHDRSRATPDAGRGDRAERRRADDPPSVRDESGCSAVTSGSRGRHAATTDQREEWMRTKHQRRREGLRVTSETRGNDCRMYDCRLPQRRIPAERAEDNSNGGSWTGIPSLKTAQTTEEHRDIM